MHWPTMEAAIVPRSPWCPTPTLRHTTIHQHATQPVYVVKTRKNNTYYYLLDYYVHNALATTMRLQATVSAAAYGLSAVVPMQ